MMKRPINPAYQRPSRKSHRLSRSIDFDVEALPDDLLTQCLEAAEERSRQEQKAKEAEDDVVFLKTVPAPLCRHEQFTQIRTMSKNLFDGKQAPKRAPFITPSPLPHIDFIDEPVSAAPPVISVFTLTQVGEDSDFVDEPVPAAPPGVAADPVALFDEKKAPKRAPFIAPSPSPHGDFIDDPVSATLPVISVFTLTQVVEDSDFVDEPVPAAPPVAAAVPITMTQMIEGEECIRDPEVSRLKKLLLSLRASMEDYVNSILKESGRATNRSLKRNIDALYYSTRRLVDCNFFQAMHAIRELGNSAAHDCTRLPSRQEAEKQMQRYLEEKKKREKQGAEIRNRAIRQPTLQYYP